LSHKTNIWKELSLLSETGEVVQCSDAGQRGITGQRGWMWLFIIAYHTGNFMVYQDLLETNLLQLFTQPENSEWFSISFGIIFAFNIASEQKQA